MIKFGELVERSPRRSWRGGRPKGDDSTGERPLIVVGCVNHWERNLRKEEIPILVVREPDRESKDRRGTVELSQAKVTTCTLPSLEPSSMWKETFVGWTGGTETSPEISTLPSTRSLRSQESRETSTLLVSAQTQDKVIQCMDERGSQRRKHLPLLRIRLE